MAGEEFRLQEPRKRFSDYFYNRITFVGVVIAIVVFTMEATLYGIDFFASHHSLYLGLFTYFVLPPFLFLGLFLIPIGALWKKRRIEKGFAKRHPEPFLFDLSKSSHRNVLLIFLAGSSLVLIASVIGGYESYQYTESVPFCGQLCHTVMKPEYTTYLQSPHARVKCVECHVGPGADNFIQSKWTGLHQVFALATHTYPRPIPAPVKNLRPARDTCEQCHSPEHFFSSKQRLIRHYLGDEKNTPWNIRMLMHIGGGGPKGLGQTGIHWHMLIHNKMKYVARAPDRQQIAWLKVVSEDGRETVYASKDKPPVAADLVPEKQRTMDCIDCHNRPTHRFLSPARVVDTALAGGQLSAALPYIKVQAVQALAGTYASDQEADQKITERLKAFYGTQDPKVVATAVAAVQEIYRRIQFPFMRSNWKAYPDNIGHLEFPGCFRCHGSDLTTKDGKTITRNCNACHTILSQGAGEQGDMISTKGLEFKHPADVDVDMKEADCISCHGGGSEVYP